MPVAFVTVAVKTDDGDAVFKKKRASILLLKLTNSSDKTLIIITRNVGGIATSICAAKQKRH